MPSRKNRSKKAIDSLAEQIEKHKQKLILAVKEGNSGLVKYYEKEIQGMEEQLRKRRKIVES